MLEWCSDFQVSSVLLERIKEIVDFAKTESPYRSANKGWIAEDVFLQLGENKDTKNNTFDELAKVSFFWQPIIQIALTLFAIIFLATILAFTPIAFSKGRFQSIQGIFNFEPQITSIEQDLDLKPKQKTLTSQALDTELEIVPSSTIEKQSNVTATNPKVQLQVPTKKDLSKNDIAGGGFVLHF